LRLTKYIEKRHMQFFCMNSGASDGSEDGLGGLADKMASTRSGTRARRQRIGGGP